MGVGYISSSGASTCTPCVYGSYQTATGQSACITCSSGTYSPGGVNLCMSTPPVVVYNLLSACTTYTVNSCNAMSGYSGYYVNCYTVYSYADDGGYGGDRRLQELEVESLEPQSYELALVDKFQVERHQYVSGVQEVCSQCGAAQFCPGTGVAYTCPAGTYFSNRTATGQNTCTTCSAGTYSPLAGATQCTVCPAGDTDQYLYFICTRMFLTCCADFHWCRLHFFHWRLYMHALRIRLLSDCRGPKRMHHMQCRHLLAWRSELVHVHSASGGV